MLKRTILSILKPVQMWLQRQGYIENNFTELDILRMYDMLKPGDILGSYESGRPTSIFIKGEYDHIAMVTDDKQVIEAVGDNFVDGKNIGGVRKVPLKEWMWKKNHIFALRNKNSLLAEWACKSYYTFVGMDYDYWFDRENEKMYCSEIPYVCYHQHDPNFLSNVPKNKDILPMDYLGCTDLELIFDTRREPK